MNFKIISTIAKKEFSAFFKSPLAYSIIVPFLILSIFIYTGSVVTSGQASLRPYFDLLPWFLLLLAPALSMRLLADDFRLNTIELIFAHPVSEFEVVLGKFLGVAGFYVITLLTTITLPVTLAIWAKVDPGQIVGQYIGALLIGATFLSIGLAASAYFKNAISSFLLGASGGFFLIVVGLDFVTLTLSYPLNGIAIQLSVLTHADSIARGLLDIRDIFYFITVISLALTGAVARISARKLVENPGQKRKLYLSFVVILTIGVLANVILSAYPLRLDLTQNQLFTLSPGTKQTVAGLPDILSLKLFASRDLPAQMQVVYQETSDMLDDYQKLNNKIQVSVAHPDVDQQAAADAATAGIQQISFNQITGGKFQVQSGYLGISLRYGDKTEVIPFVSDTSDLEYQLTRRIRKITQSQAVTIGLVTGTSAQTSLLNKALSSQYSVEALNPQDSTRLSVLSAVVVIDDGTLTDSSASAALIKSYLAQNGHVLFFAGGLTINQQNMSASSNNSQVLKLLSDYGITVNHNLVYDLRLNELLSMGQGTTSYIAPYAYWVKSSPADPNFAPLASIPNVSLLWPSSISVTDKPGFSYTNLLTTSSAGGTVDSNFDLSPQTTTNLTPLGSQLVAVLAESAGARLAVVGDSMIPQDTFLQSNPDNLNFISGLVDYLATPKGLAPVPSKVTGSPVFNFTSPADARLFQYGNLIFAPAVVIIFAAFYLRRRRSLYLRRYHAK